MLFNSLEFLFLFLPCSFAAYFLLNKLKLAFLAKVWLVCASVFFYGWWDFKFIPLLVGSILFNYLVGRMLLKLRNITLVQRKMLLAAGILGNLVPLAFFKYFNFILDNLTALTGLSFPSYEIILPLGISFFSFTQIAYLVDSYKDRVQDYNPVNYMLFVTFFPHLLAGPIIHHKEMMPQFNRLRNSVICYKNIATGLAVISVGLFKKVSIADTLAITVNYGFASPDSLTAGTAWLTSLAYSFQIYFDFSGYTDIALGASLLFNIRLPFNFDTPYRSITIREFWRRWHITLGRFLRDYVYIPLGGDKKGELFLYLNIFLTFCIGGIWHGAGWTFIIWGVTHGVALIICRIWETHGFRLPNILAFILTFNFVNVSWIFFRARTVTDASTILSKMFDLSALSISKIFSQLGGLLPQLRRFWAGINMTTSGQETSLCIIILSFVSLLFTYNSNSILKTFRLTPWNTVLFIVTAIVAITMINRTSEFLYFNF